MDNDKVVAFCEITGADPPVAVRVLEMANGDVEGAIQLFFEHPELQAAPPVPAAASTTTPSNRAPTQQSRIGREDEQGVITIDSDDDDIDNDDDDDADFVQAVAKTAQEDEDAAMARRLQEEMYSAAPGGLDDGVRSPIARRTETLVEWDDAPSDAAMRAMMERQRLRHQTHNPFNQSIWTNTDPVTVGSSASADPNVGLGPQATTMQSRSQRLAELFRPPFDLMYRLSWDDARAEGKEDKKWLLVNLQDMSDFNCQALNRDIWKDDLIKELVREHFIFLQYAREDEFAEQYVSFYFPGRQHENPDIYPHVCIIDPRTGEQVKVWSGMPFPSALDFHRQLIDFLDRYSLSSGSKNPVIKEVKRTRTIDVDRMTEDEMLEMALQNSLEANGAASSSRSNVVDPDELTKGSARTPIISPGQPQSPFPARDPTPAPAPTSPFMQISSTTPHVEPANDPATTTRIQFRHPSGRVIRRFRLDDGIRRIYEWLKAEPIQGMPPGGEFELKVMPQGQDLIESLDETIAAMGLKNGTVMIEFIAD